MWRTRRFGRDYQDWLDAIDTYTPKRSELWNTSGTYKDSMTTPTVTINGKFWDMNQLSTAQETIEEGLLEAIGIKSDDIGKGGRDALHRLRQGSDLQHHWRVISPTQSS